MTRIAYVASALALALVACRGGGDDTSTGDDTVDPDAPPVGGDVTIQEVQDDAMPVGTQIELRGVVVTAVDQYGDRAGDFWVGEPEGGPFSGVKVYGAPREKVAELQVGDLVDITNAIKHEACTQAAPCGSVVFDDGAGITEVEGVSANSLVVTKLSAGTAPAPTVVDAKAIAALPSKEERIAEWEKWEGVLIKVTNARQLSEVAPFGSNPGIDSNEFRITGVARVQSVLAELPATATAGTCYDSITGVGDFFFNNLILPRSASDLVGDGTGCLPAVESIAELRSATTPPEFVKLTDVYVSAVSYNKKQLWLSSSLTAAPNEGVYVYRGSSTSASVLPADVVAGAKVTVMGAGAEFDGNNGGETVTQVVSPSITVTAAPTGTVTPVPGQSVSDLLAAATGEPYEGVLVSLSNVKVSALGTDPNFIADLAQFPDNAAFKADDDIYRFVAGDLNQCFDSITGIWTYNPYDDRFVFVPTATGTGTGTCN